MGGVSMIIPILTPFQLERAGRRKQALEHLENKKCSDCTAALTKKESKELVKEPTILHQDIKLYFIKFYGSEYEEAVFTLCKFHVNNHIDEKWSFIQKELNNKEIFYLQLLP